jgi:predicted metal-dependent RNase
MSFVIDGRVGEVCDIYDEYADRKAFISKKINREYEGEPLFSVATCSNARDLYKRTDEFKDFVKFYIRNKGCCIVTSSGMLLEDSASYNYAKELIDGENNEIIFTGYQEETSWNIYNSQKVLGFTFHLHFLKP